MMPDEKDQLLTLFLDASRWCRDAEARDLEGVAVAYDDTAAVSWDITGALTRLFGWPRACALFEQLDRHIHGKQSKSAWPPVDASIEAMVELQAFNDNQETTFDHLRERIQTLPVWRGAMAAAVKISSIPRVEESADQDAKEANGQEEQTFGAKTRT